MKKYKLAVMGNPIAHSRSPIIHNFFAKAVELEISYEKLLVPFGGFDETVRSFIRKGGYGFNVTLPCKRDAWSLADRLSSSAAEAEAVNTVLIDNNGFLTGENTDGIGLIKDIEVNLAKTIPSKKILVLGAGGAVSGVMKSLVDRNPLGISVYNRTREKSEKLAKKFSGRVEALDLDELADDYDFLINGTSIGIASGQINLPKRILDKVEFCYDMVYDDGLTPFQRWCQENSKCRAYNGIGMLVEQAAEAFAFWFGKRPETLPVIEKLRKEN
ncbi:MAG: shikimate dehydrogenase [Gammaproteobacteria bacterium]|nr:shikimate dehydrogenase [Gammaproteobacteria bacterium]|tara:strand:- start:219 stop:1034 length:816 start_codon:yes stop_codon:yes gene_type:complete